MKRKGSAIFVAVILGTIFSIVVFALMVHESGEVKHIKTISSIRKAELLALSGISWAENKLRQKDGRWYGEAFVPYEVSKVKHKSCGIETITPFGANEGTVTIVCEDVANKNWVRDLHGMQRLWLLHHINVYSLGENEGHRCLYYARYIISPEPLLNSKSTEGADFEFPEFYHVEALHEDDGSPRGGLVGVQPPEDLNSKGERVDRIYKYIDLIAKEGDYVDQNTIVAEVESEGDEIKRPVYPKDSGYVLYRFEDRIREYGERFPSDLEIMVLDKYVDANSFKKERNKFGIAQRPIQPKTLKKMVRITKIPNSFWEEKELNIKKISDRYLISQYITKNSDYYLNNFIAHLNLEDALKNIGDKKFESKMDASEVLKNFPINFTSTTRNRAENTFLLYMLKSFTNPDEPWSEKEKSLRSSYITLDTYESTESEEKKKIEEILSGFTPSLLQLTESKTKLNSLGKYQYLTLFNDKFIKELNLHLNDTTDKFIDTLSKLEDSKRVITINKQCPFDEEKISQSDRLDKQGSRIIDKIDGDTLYEIKMSKVTNRFIFKANNEDSDTSFFIEMRDLLNFFRKYYDDENAQCPRELERTSEFIDWPLPLPRRKVPEPAKPQNTTVDEGSRIVSTIYWNDWVYGGKNGKGKVPGLPTYYECKPGIDGDHMVFTPESVAQDFLENDENIDGGKKVWNHPDISLVGNNSTVTVNSIYLGDDWDTGNENNNQNEDKYLLDDPGEDKIAPIPGEQGVAPDTSYWVPRSETRIEDKNQSGKTENTKDNKGNSSNSSGSNGSKSTPSKPKDSWNSSAFF